MSRRVAAFVVTLLLGSPLVAAARRAALEVPAALAAVEPLDVSGSNPRRWGRPLAFGAFRTEATRDGTDRGWSFEALGVGVAGRHLPYGFVLAGGAAPLEVACHTRGLDLFRGSLAFAVRDALRPRLVCAVRSEAAGEPARRLALGVRGALGAFEGAMGSTATPEELTVRSLHRLEGSPLRLQEPAGYLLTAGSDPVAAVETINRGRAWLAPALDPGARDRAAATIAALLLFRPDTDD